VSAENAKCLIVLNQKPPFFLPKGAKKRPKFFFQKAPQFWFKVPHFETFEVENYPPCHFYSSFMQQFFQEELKIEKYFKI